MWSLLVLFLVAVAEARQFFNPVIDSNNPDPGVIKTNGVYYAVTTTGNGGSKFGISYSVDLQNWAPAGYVFNDDTRPKWAISNDAFWAPELHAVNNKFLCYFTARSSDNRALSIGVAWADNILGPYNDIGRPLFTDPNMGSIDATILRADNGIYLVWKDDGNAVGKPTYVWAQHLNGDGLSFDDNTRHLILRDDQPWEGNLIEGVWHVPKDGWHYLFYSGNGYCGDAYAVGVARSRDPLGPYEKRNGPILTSNDAFTGPGHCSVVRDVNDSDYVMVYHAWHRGSVCGGNPRVMLANSVAWGNDGWPFMTN